MGLRYQGSAHRSSIRVAMLIEDVVVVVEGTGIFLRDQGEQGLQLLPRVAPPQMDLLSNEEGAYGIVNPLP